MSNKFFNFYYDPIRQGYDTNTWTTISGVPAIIANKLVIDTAEIVHFADLLRGDTTFNLTVSAPQAGDSAIWGFNEISKSEYAYFDIIDDVFSASVSSSGVSTSVVIPWNSDWNDTATNYRIRWEAGSVKFYVNGALQVTIDESYVAGVLTTSVPNDPMSLYLAAVSPIIYVNYIDVQGVESSNLIV